MTWASSATGQIAGTGADHGDFAFAAQSAVAPDAHGAGGGEVLGLRMLALETLGGGRIGARDENVLGLVEQARDDGADLVGSLALAEDDFRNSVPQRAMMIDLGEAQVFERQVAQAFDGRVDVHRSGADLFEQAAQMILIHTSPSVARNIMIRNSMPRKKVDFDTVRRIAGSSAGGRSRRLLFNPLKVRGEGWGVFPEKNPGQPLWGFVFIFATGGGFWVLGGGLRYRPFGGPSFVLGFAGQEKDPDLSAGLGGSRTWGPLAGRSERRPGGVTRPRGGGGNNCWTVVKKRETAVHPRM